MKMKNYRLFIVSFVTASFILLTGFEKPGVNNALPSANEVKKVQSKSKESLVKPKQKTKNKQEAVAEEAEFQKPLDLSMPFKDSENAWLTIEQNKAVQGESLNIFASEKNKRPRPLYLDSQVLMSQEPEVDKRKSLDGAGIVINLKR
ncbi:hypothetical protein [Methylobacter tundripaludum]|uniref:Uncharacterized protein n=1 Tax=Methylobacter tundripaludum (strain ATCC BAA-1195 / DSM 17260 / SV96) TaxID=697282 RepID=G3IV59_METTV|nr:hypothetical protein [Methylobacter tundripaludum]EGW21672.1 hypothetical protein Mettu_0444 [Methylobacter tundripaludum SV96]